MRVTRKDVAEYAGVSEQTVSYVLNGTRTFSDKVVKKVQKAVEALHYKPDMIARGMVTQKTNTVAVVVNDLANPIFPRMIHGFQERAAEFGYSVYISDIAGCADVKSRMSDLIVRRIDGVYISLISDNYMDEIVNNFLMNNIKVVVGNKDQSIQYDVPCVRTDFFSGMRKILMYLQEKGHKNIVYFSGLNIDNESDERYIAFSQIYKELFDSEPQIIENEDPYTTTAEDGMRMTKKWLQEKTLCTAIITTNDLMAYGVIDTLVANGIRVPEDISVVGIDDILYSRYVNPPLTTLGYDDRALGQEIFGALKFLMDNDGCEIKERLIDTYVVERETVKECK